MADYISRDEAIQLFNDWVDDLDKQINDSTNYPHLRSDYKVCKTQLLDCIHAIKEIPAADVVKIVRCKDCKYYKEGKLLGPTKFCYYYQIGTGLNTADDDFCSHGIRRADNG